LWTHRQKADRPTLVDCALVLVPQLSGRRSAVGHYSWQPARPINRLTKRKCSPSLVWHALRAASKRDRVGVHSVANAIATIGN
jgi:hypothetical protein